jgi:MFS family permease
VLSLLCCVQFLLVLDVTVVNVALPELRADLLLSTAQAQWALTAYLVPFGALLLVGGRLGDRYGRRRVLVAGLVLFAVGNLLAAVSTGFTWLVLARALTGVGAAAASPSALALLVTCFPSGPAHARAFAAWGGVGAAGAAAGVLLGGLLTSWLGWRAVFAIAVPVTTLLIAAAPRLLPRALPSRPRTVDLLGALLSAVAAGACLLALGRTGELGWNAPEVHVWHTVATAAVVLLWLHLRRTPDPLVDLELLHRRTVLAGTTLMACAAGTLVCAFLLTSLLLQERLGHSALRTGLEFLPAAVATAVAARRAGALVGRWGQPSRRRTRTRVSLVGRTRARRCLRRRAGGGRARADAAVGRAGGGVRRRGHDDDGRRAAGGGGGARRPVDHRARARSGDGRRPGRRGERHRRWSGPAHRLPVPGGRGSERPRRRPHRPARRRGCRRTWRVRALSRALVSVGMTSLALGATSGWPVSLLASTPGAARRLRIAEPRRLLQVHIDWIVMGVVLIAVGVAAPDLTRVGAGPAAHRGGRNPLLFLPLAFGGSRLQQTWPFRAAAACSFAALSVALVAVAWAAW